MKLKKEWSLPVMLKMLSDAGFESRRKLISDLTIPEWNALGDWLYYQVHKDETDHVKNRPVPQRIGVSIHRVGRINWQKRFGDLPNDEE